MFCKPNSHPVFARVKAGISLARVVSVLHYFVGAGRGPASGVCISQNCL